MINTKRGLSDIITNVLIILLVLVAVGIIWAFVRPAIQGGAQQVAGASDCLAVNVVPTACSNTVTGATTGADLWNVTVSMGTGSTANIEELKFIFRDSTGAVVATKIEQMPIAVNNVDGFWCGTFGWFC